MAEKAAAWAGVAPGNNGSAGKRAIIATAHSILRAFWLMLRKVSLTGNWAEMTTVSMTANVR